MRQVIMCVGLPGSGKSYWTAKQVAQHPDQFKRINRDSLRQMIDGGKWSEGREKFIRKAELALAEEVFVAGYTPIIDDVNLSVSAQKMWLEFATRMKAKLVVQDFTQVPLDVCITNDLNRERSVGEAVIRDWYNKWLRVAPALRQSDPTLPKAILVDVDGTLAWKGDRDVYDATKAYLDTLNPAVALVVRQCADVGITVIVMSGRQEKDRQVTEEWLLTNTVPFDFLFMRATGDTRRDAVVKQELYESNVEGQYDVQFVLDDRQQVVDMWRRLGLQCWQVQEGQY